MPPIPQIQAAGFNSVAASDGTQLNPLAVNIAKAIRQSESGGDYNAIGDSGESHGAYQFNKGNFKDWASQYGLDPNDNSPVNQDKVAYSRINDLLKQGRSPSEVAAIWNGAKLVNGTYQAINPSYVTKVKDNYAKLVDGSTGNLAQAPEANLSSVNIPPPTAPGQTAPTQPVDAAGYAPPTPPPAPAQSTTPASSDSSDPSGGFLQGLSEDVQGDNPNSIGTQIANTAKGAGNFLFPIVGDIGNDLTGKNQKTALQQAGDLGLSALPFIPGIGEAGDVLRGGDLAVEGAADAAKSGVLKKVLGSTVGKGAASGYGAGVLSNLSNGQGIVQSLTPNSTNVESALTGGVAGAVIPKVAEMLGKSPIDAGIEKSIQEVMPLENKATRIDALRASLPGTPEGGVVRKGLLGASTIVPDAEDIERGTTAHPFIQGTNDPVAKIQNLNQGIKDTSTQTDDFLDKNATAANFEDMRNYMETNKPSSILQKDPAAAESYNRATQDALDTLASTMKETQKATGNFGPQTSGADIRKARIAVDAQISKELGESTFGTPQFKGIKAAEIDTRNLLNRMSEDMLRYPGQLENLNKMNDFVSASKGRGIDVDMNDPTIKSQLESTFGLKSTPETEASAKALSDAHKKMSYLYDSRDNLIDKYQNKIGKNKIQETVAKNPLLKAGVAAATKAVPFGLADHLTK